MRIVLFILIFLSFKSFASWDRETLKVLNNGCLSAAGKSEKAIEYCRCYTNLLSESFKFSEVSKMLRSGNLASNKQFKMITNYCNK